MFTNCIKIFVILFKFFIFFINPSHFLRNKVFNKNILFSKTSTY